MSATCGCTVAEVEARLPRKFFVKRKDIVRACGLNRKEIKALFVTNAQKLSAAERRALVQQGRFVAEYLPGESYGRYVRSQVLAAAQVLEGH